MNAYKVLAFFFLLLYGITAQFQIAQAQPHALEIRAGSEEILIHNQTDFFLFLDGEEIAEDSVQTARLVLARNGEVLASANINVGQPEFSYRFFAPGFYTLDARVEFSTGEIVEKNTQFQVLARPAEASEVARGVLILSVAGGVLLALTLGLIIFLQGRHKQKSGT